MTTVRHLARAWEAGAVTSPALDGTRCACGRVTHEHRQTVPASGSACLDRTLCRLSCISCIHRHTALVLRGVSVLLLCILDRWGRGLLTSSSRRVQQQDQPQQRQQQPQISTGPRAARPASCRRAMAQASGLAAAVLLAVVWAGSLSLQVHFIHRPHLQLH